MSLFPRAFNQETSPVFRMMDDYASLTRNLENALLGTSGNTTHGAWNKLRSFQPRFDVSETKEGYTLHGELPGIENKNVNIEWTDGNTLTISGRTEHRYESENAEPADKSHYTKPAVEETADESDAGKGPASAEVAKTDAAKDVAKNENAPKYWISERSVGSFHRSFSFPARVDQEKVKASMKNGILEITVPKAAKPENKKIAIHVSE